MKQLVTAAQVKAWAEKQEKTICLEPRTIITPAARDAARDLGITFVEKSLQEEKAPSLACQAEEKESLPPVTLGLDPSLIARIVEEVLSNLQKTTRGFPPIKEKDPSGLVLIRGDGIFGPSFSPGCTPEGPLSRKILDPQESPRLTAGFASLEDCSFTREQAWDEVCYIIDGTLEINLKGKTYLARQGDAVFFPGSTRALCRAQGPAKYFYVSCPAGCR